MTDDVNLPDTVGVQLAYFPLVTQTNPLFLKLNKNHKKTLSLTVR
jgi:hypothetical protein